MKKRDYNVIILWPPMFVGRVTGYVQGRDEIGPYTARVFSGPDADVVRNKCRAWIVEATAGRWVFEGDLNEKG